MGFFFGVVKFQVFLEVLDIPDIFFGMLGPTLHVHIKNESTSLGGIPPPEKSQKHMNASKPAFKDHHRHISETPLNGVSLAGR